MMNESSCAFDEAMSKPFLGEPVKKKWSLLPSMLQRRSSTYSAYTSATVLSGDDDSSTDSSFSGGEYKAPSMVSEDEDEGEIVFQGNSVDFKNKSIAELELTVLGDLKPMDVEAGMLQERHGSFVEMTKSMHQILEIQNDLSALVSSQGVEIEDLQSAALEASEHAGTGVKHLMSVNLLQEQTEQRRSFLLLLLILLATALWAGPL